MTLQGLLRDESACGRPARLELPRTLWSNALVKGARLLALDYGTRRVGVALCDEMGVAVRPVPALVNKGSRDLVARIRRLVELHHIEGLVVGLPLNMDGTAGESATSARNFMRTLQTDLNLPLTAVDERLTTIEATEIWKTMSPRRQRKYGSADSLAAALILQRFLEEP